MATRATARGELDTSQLFTGGTALATARGEPGTSRLFTGGTAFICIYVCILYVALSTDMMRTTPEHGCFLLHSERGLTVHESSNEGFHLCARSCLAAVETPATACAHVCVCDLAAYSDRWSGAPLCLPFLPRHAVPSLRWRPSSRAVAHGAEL